MRKTTFLALLIMGATGLMLMPAVTVGQIQFGGKGKSKGTGGGFGSDPGAIFDTYLAKGRSFFLISEVRMGKDALTAFAQERGITNGQITRQQYMDYQEYTKNKKAAQAAGQPMGGGFNRTPGGDNAGPMGNGPKGGKDRVAPPSPNADSDTINNFADGEFKRSDRNDDGKLNRDEMKDSLRNNLTRWDRNGDMLIDLDEFRAYFSARIHGDDGNPNRAIATIIIQESDLDRKEVVFKAGSLPRNIPSWFKELDTDVDGQVALYEWRAGKKQLDEFANWDLNDDGFIIPEEAVRTQEILAKNTTRGDGSSLSGERPQGFGGKKGEGGFGGFGGKKGEGTGGFGGFGGKKGEGTGGFGGFGGKKGEGTGGFGGFGGRKNSEANGETPANPFGGFGKKNKKGGN